MTNKFTITVCCLLCSIIFISVFAFESKLGNVKIFNFVKLRTVNNSFNFKYLKHLSNLLIALYKNILYSYLANNGSSFNGETIHIFGGGIHFLIDGDGSIYWVDLTEEIKNSTTIFTKPAISGKY